MNVNIGSPINSEKYGVSWEHLAAGAVARISSVVILSPFDVIKNRLQFQGKISGIRTFTGPLNALNGIFRQEGIAALYRGLLPRLLYTVPSSAVSFFFYEHFHRIITSIKTGKSIESSSPNSFSPLVPLFAGAIARVFGTAARTPFDIVKQRLQIQGSLLTPEKLRSPIQMIQSIIKLEGGKSFFSGYRVTLLRDAPFAAIYFSSYEALNTLQQYHISQPLSSKNYLLSGALAGGFSSIATFPVDTVKVRLQSQGLLSLSGKHSQRSYSGIIDAFQQIYRTEGFFAFYKGASMRMMYIAPAAALTFASYEYFKRFFISLTHSNEIPETDTQTEPTT